MTRSQQTPPVRALPERPNLEHLKNEAKQRLDEIRRAEPGAQLSDAQFRLARDYGFSSWRDLKAKVEAVTVGTVGTVGTVVDLTGDWIGQALRNRLALHLHRNPDGAAYRAVIDLPDSGVFGLVMDDVEVNGDRLSFVYTDAGGLYEGRWAAQDQAWIGEWKVNGHTQPLNLSRGIFPPNPTVTGLDGLWDGLLVGPDGEESRFSFRIRTDEHGTSGMFHSPDTNIRKAPLRGIHRDGAAIRLEMRTFVVTGPLSETGDVIDGEFRKGDWTGPLVLKRRRPGEAGPQKTAPAPVELPVEALERLAGTYAFSQGRALTVRLDDGRLHAAYDGQPESALTAIGPYEFRYPLGDSGLTFFEDEEGDGVRLKLENFVDWGRKQA